MTTDSVAGIVAEMREELRASQFVVEVSVSAFKSWADRLEALTPSAPAAEGPAPLAGQREDADWNTLKKWADANGYGGSTDSEARAAYALRAFTRPASDAVVDDARLIAAYDAGFEASSEGWNGEHGGNTDSPYYINKRNEYFATLTSQQAGGKS